MLFTRRTRAPSGASDAVWMVASRERAAQVLRARKALKRKMALAANKFNSNAKDWIEFVQELGYGLPLCLCTTLFLRKCSRAHVFIC